MPVALTFENQGPLELADGKLEQLQPLLVSTLVPPAPSKDAEDEDPDGHTVWMTTATSQAQYHAHKGWPFPLPKLPKNKLVVRPTEDGAGLGVFATDDIKRYEPVLVERPFLIYAQENSVLPIPSEGVKELSESQIAQMLMKKSEEAFRCAIEQQFSAKAKEEFMSLANSHLDDGSGPVLGIVRTNGFAIKFGERLPGVDEEFRGGYAAVSRIGSRLNHSCIPDVVFGFDPATFSMRFTAVRDIKAGSQIHTSYTTVTAPKLTRQKALSAYGFECHCRACLQSTPQSDKLRQVCHKLTQLWRNQAINVWPKDLKLTEKVLVPVLETKRRMEEDGLDFDDAGYCFFPEILHRVYKCVGNKEKEREAFELTRETVRGMIEAAGWRSGVNLLG
ncbi:hypothetical protein CC1G_03976 [Coprinopsis cinerea okayama7|uniref:SET domain-containing protein n=1 Tax=Coprinopsis cinerea (strain Okayama-7 / 130 / ATCC MYA-4618 / FGSC 9003) TaxID=240176 RepID=A8N8C9_COPC7|nr:hypothetical protein CC1G_03976 [Coprinopsis cinerea okayama7\|eukprot:XP_001831085.1 hypothetical protein CC1G_03976 [Coprinopsis cinerea okayama7\